MLECEVENKNVSESRVCRLSLIPHKPADTVAGILLIYVFSLTFEAEKFLCSISVGRTGVGLARPLPSSITMVTDNRGQLLTLFPLR